MVQASPTLDLVKDYLHFVVVFFGVINTSAPHIYHSALLLSPQKSIVRRLYGKYSHPFARVVHGLLESWEPILASLYLENLNCAAVWSPCSKFIAIANWGSTEILDAATLNQLSILQYSSDTHGQDLSFTPDSCTLTQCSTGGEIISWDIQTGGSHSTNELGYSQLSPDPFSSTYSTDGEIIAVAYKPLPKNDGGEYLYHNGSHSIVTLNLFGTHIHTHHISKGPILPPIWTHGQCFQFATMKQSLITIWEAMFTSTDVPAEVESLSVPDEIIDGEHFLFFSALFRLAFILGDTIQILDVRASRLLLKTRAFSGIQYFWNLTRYPSWGSFSSNGHLFACIFNTGVHIWKESPSGYILHQKLTFSIPSYPIPPCLSPNGESITMSLRSTIHLWPTRDQILSPDTSAGGDNEGDFILGFSPNKEFVAFARQRGNIVKILDLQSGDLLLATDMDMEISCMQMTENTVIVIGEGKIVSWNLPQEMCTFKSEANIKSSIKTTTLELSSHTHNFSNISVSPDLSQIAVPEYVHSAGVPMHYLGVYDIPTGRHLGGVETFIEPIPMFTLDGHQIWDEMSYSGWEILQDSNSDTIELKPLRQTAHLSGLFPFHSSCCYGVTNDGWVLSPAQKRLLWLPQRWRSTWKDRTWSGQFLALLHCELSDVVILEFLE